MKAQSGLNFPPEMCFGIMNTTKDSYLINSKVAFLKRGQNTAGIFPFFYGATVQCKVNIVKFVCLDVSETPCTTTFLHLSLQNYLNV